MGGCVLLFAFLFLGGIVHYISSNELDHSQFISPISREEVKFVMRERDSVVMCDVDISRVIGEVVCDLMFE